MEVKRFRNHFSSVIEQFGAAFVVVIAVILESLDSFVDLIADIINSEEVKIGGEALGALMILCIFTVLVIVFTIWRFWVWSKTWIVIDEDTLTVEKNTLNSAKNTIGLKNISNVNTEQNIFEMLIGTCKVKLDTNSLSTANSTDVKIILKKKQAEALRAYLIKRINEINHGIAENETISDFEDSDYDIKADLKDILLNGIYSINVFGIIMFLGSFGFMVVGIMELIEEGVGAESLTGIFGGILAAFLIAITTLYGLISGFVKLYGFMIKREEDRIYIKYGLFKRVNYAIPIDKINAVIIHQTLIARIFHKYTAEIVNVGMDDEKDSTAYFTFYSSKEKMMDVIEKIIPEFSEAVGIQINRQPKSVWIMKIMMVLWIELFFAIGVGISVYVFDMPLWLWAVFVLAAAVVQIIYAAMSYITVGSSIQKNYLGLKSGAFGTHYTIIKFDKVQYVSFQQNIITKKLGIIKGRVNILASLGKMMHSIPYIPVERCEQIEKELADWRT